MQYLSSMLNKRIKRNDGSKLGRLDDVVIKASTKFPVVEGMIVRTGRKEKWRRYFIKWDDMEITDNEEFIAWKYLDNSEIDGSYFRLCRDLLDKQIVDLEGYKIVRVTDVRLAKSGRRLRVLGVDVGILAILRRLGLGYLSNRFKGRLKGEIWDKTVSWNLLAPVEPRSYNLKLVVPYKEYLKGHPSDVADIVEQLDVEQRAKVFALIDDPRAAEILVHVIPGMREEIAASFDDERLSDLLEVMPPDEAADILGTLPRSKAQLLLSLMEIDEASVVSELLGYDPETAGGKMTTGYIAVSQDMNPEMVMREIREKHAEAETIYYLYVVDSENHISGVLSLRDLLRAEPFETVGNIMVRDVITSNVMDGQEDVADKLMKYNLLALPVVDDDHVLKGIVTYDDAINVMMEEMGDDLSRVSGIPYEDEGKPVTGLLDRRRWYWTLLTFAGGIIATALLSIFKSILLASVALVYFIPLAMRTTHDVSVWSLASSAYGLTQESFSSVNWRETFRLEYVYTFIVACITAAITFFAGRVWTQNVSQGAAAAVGVFVAILLAGVLGIIIPAVLFQMSYGKIKSEGRVVRITVMATSMSAYLLIGYAVVRYWG